MKSFNIFRWFNPIGSKFIYFLWLINFINLGAVLDGIFRYSDCASILLFFDNWVAPVKEHS